MCLYFTLQRAKNAMLSCLHEKDNIRKKHLVDHGFSNIVALGTLQIPTGVLLVTPRKCSVVCKLNITSKLFRIITF